jgi:thiamine pyrophosphokinase
MNVLIVCAASQTGSVELVGRLAPGFDAVIAVDGGGALCRAAAVTPTVLLGDLDSLPEDDLRFLQSAGVPVRRFPADKDASDLELALTESRAMGAAHVTVTAASSGRLDHTVVGLGVVAAAFDLQPRLIEPSTSVWVLDARGRGSVELAGEGATVSLVPFGGPAVVSASGVRWPLDRAELLPTGSRGLSNVIGSAGVATLAVHAGTVLVMSSRVADVAPAQER